MQFHIDFTRTGGSISVTADGNITNGDVCTINSSSLYPAIQAPAISGGTGRIAAGIVTPAGLVQIVSVSGGANIATNDTFSFNAVYVL